MDNEVIICPACGSANVERIECSGPSGVRSPDGGIEYFAQTGILCRDCGAMEED